MVGGKALYSKKGKRGRIMSLRMVEKVYNNFQEPAIELTKKASWVRVSIGDHNFIVTPMQFPSVKGSLVVSTKMMSTRQRGEGVWTEALLVEFQRMSTG